MPSAKIPGALLNLYETEGQPWQWSTWQATTGLTAAPWSGAPGSLPSEWTQDDAAKVKAFVANYLAIPSSNWKRRAAYLKTSGKRGMKRKEALDDASVNSETDSDEEDSDAVGRKKWCAWVNDLGRRVLSKEIDKLLEDTGRHPMELIKVSPTRKVGHVGILVP